MRPLVYIDVDGTINPCNVPEVLDELYPDRRVAHGLSVSVGLWDSIYSLPADLKWLSAWCLNPDHLDSTMAQLGLDSTRVERNTLPLHLGTLEWKLDNVVTALESRRVVLLDDDVELHELLGEREGLLLVCPDTYTGLRLSDIDKVRSFLND